MPIRQRGTVVVPQIRKPPAPRLDDTGPIISDAELLAGLRTLSHPDKGGLSINIWPRSVGGFQANVQVKGEGSGWTVAMSNMPITALKKAIASRLR